MNAPLSQHGPAGEPRPGIGAGAGGYDKAGFLREYASRFKVRTLVETGLYQGRGSGMDVAGVEYVAIDYQLSNVVEAKKIRDGTYLVGDSAVVLRHVLEGVHDDVSLEPPALFWLDAHAISDEENAPTVCPVAAELEAIIGWEHAASSVVLIDDLWGMGTVRGWPTLDELREVADRGPWHRVEQDGTMRLTPR